MRSPRGIRRVIVVILDGLRPDAIGRFNLTHLQRLGALGASTTATTVHPSITVAAMTSLLTGVQPNVHGVISERLHIPRAATQLSPLPRELAAAGFPSSAFLARIPSLFRGIAARLARQVGVGEVRFVGDCAAEIFMAARQTLRTQRRGLILMHLPDADRAGHDYGWMTDEYGDAARRLDATVGLIAAIADVPRDPATLLIALADHGGGGITLKDHESEHPYDRNIPVVLAGAGAGPQADMPEASLLDVPSTVLWALGVTVPPSYQGRPLASAFHRAEERGGMVSRPDPRDAPPAVA